MTNRSTDQRDMIDYLYVGGHKCGSTWLFDMMCQHPRICEPRLKEPNFFSSNYHRGYDYYYSLWAGPGLKGEFSQSYFTDRTALERIRDHNPTVKLIVSLRNPYERMLSHCSQWRRLEEQHRYDLNSYIDRHPVVLQRSLYGRHLQTILELFPADNIHVICLEDIAESPITVLTGVFDFLGIAADHTPGGYDRQIGRGFTPRSAGLEKLRQTLFRGLCRFGFGKALHLARRAGLGRLYRRVNSRKEGMEQLRLSVDLLDELAADLCILRALLVQRLSATLQGRVDTWLRDIEARRDR